MAWSGSGTFTPVDTVEDATTATATEMNNIINDLGTGINTALAKDGQNVMTGALRLASGTAAAPGLSFSADTDCGLFRIGANNIGIGVNQTKILDIATTGISITGTLAASGNVAINTDKFTVNATNGNVAISGNAEVAGRVSELGALLLPPGVILPYGGTTEPSGFLFCYGQAISRSTYSDLFDVIGTTYGAGDTSTTFNLPDIRGRVVAGQDDMGGTSANRLTDQTGGLNGDTLGATGGAETHTLTTAQMPAHTHNVSYRNATAAAGGGDYVLFDIASLNHATSSTGGGGAHNNVQPTIILNYIIKI